MLELLDSFLDAFSEPFHDITWVRTEDSLLFDEFITVTFKDETFNMHFEGGDEKDDTKFEDPLELAEELFTHAFFIRMQIMKDNILEELEEVEEEKPKIKKR